MCVSLQYENVYRTVSQRTSGNTWSEYPFHIYFEEKLLPLLCIIRFKQSGTYYMYSDVHQIHHHSHQRHHTATASGYTFHFYIGIRCQSTYGQLKITTLCKRTSKEHTSTKRRSDIVTWRQICTKTAFRLHDYPKVPSEIPHPLPPTPP